MITTKFVYRDGKVVEATPATRRARVHEVMADAYELNPTVSPIDGTMIDSRARLREHNARHSCVDVGDDSVATGAYRPTPNSRHEIRREIHEAIARLRG